MCDIKECDKPSTVLVEGGYMLCASHAHMPKKYVCKHCHVPMVAKNDHRPVLGRSHSKKCPRHRLLG